MNKQPRLIIGDSRRKNLSTVSLLDPSPKQIRKASIQIPKGKENNPSQKYQSGPNEDLKKQISQLIKIKTNPTISQQSTQRCNSQLKKKLDIVCEEVVEMDDLKSYQQPPNECAFDEVTLRYLHQKESEYRVNQMFFERQEQIRPLMRSTLIDWLAEVCKEFTLKRETFHLCVHNLDRYLSKVSVAKCELQLVGLSSLYIACKIEEIYPPKVSDFSQASKYGFSNTQILDKELQIVKTLKWMLNPPTLYLWTTWYFSQWDLYFPQKSTKQLALKQPLQYSYTLFRQFMAILDCVILDLRIYTYTHREIVASLMYLVLLKQYAGCTFQRIFEGKVVEREVSDFLHIYKPFVEIVFGFQFSQLAKPVRYLTKFLSLEITIEQPNTSKIPAEKEYEEAYEYFLSIQTHNIRNMDFMQKM